MFWKSLFLCIVRRIQNIRYQSHYAMRTIILSAAAVFALGVSSLAQKPITVEGKDIAFKHNIIPGFLVTIPEVENKTIRDSWIYTLEKGAKLKAVDEAGDLTVTGTLIPEISQVPINVYSYILNQDSVNLLYVSFELDSAVYIIMDERRGEFAKARQFLVNFAKNHYLDVAGKQLESEGKKLKEMESDLKSMEKEKVKYEKLLKANAVDISAANDKLNVFRNNLKNLNDELMLQNNQYNAMSKGPAKDEKKKYINDLESRIKKTNNSIVGVEEDIVDFQEEVSKVQNDLLPSNLQEQLKLKENVTIQKEVVRVAKEKYNNIKTFR